MSADQKRTSSKFVAHRQRKRETGKKLVRLWILDPAAPGFAEEAERQASVLRGAAEEDEALAFIEAAGDFRDWTE